MIIVFFFVSAVLSCLPLLHSATEGNTSLPICPESFSCPKLFPFKYPFYNATENGCGLIQVNCTSRGGNIQVGGKSYKIVAKNDFGSSVLIHNKTFEKLVNTSSCEALMDNFTSPSPLSYSISIAPFITLFKCSKYLSDAPQTDTYFHQSNYNRFNICKDHNFYYKYLINDATEPSDLPHTCQVIQLPLKFHRVLPNESNIYSLLSSNFSISFNFCQDCHKIGKTCHALDGQFQCLDANKVATKGPARNLKLIRARSDKRMKFILAATLGVGGVITLVLLILCFKRKIRERTKTKNQVNVEEFLNNHEFLAPKRYSYSDVKKMTSLFNVKLGQGGYGSVYKGSLSNGMIVAVKVLSESKGNGEDFINEVASVGRTSHVNIVTLVGFCFEHHLRALIYEFMPNGSLEKFIYDRDSSGNSQLGWEKLHQIVIGIARGLEYLHNGCNTQILHFDIKPHNILLDNDFCPKICDFGLAKIFPVKRSKMTMSHMRGTPGYIAPELFSRNFGGVSHKSDVYSYGMMILEMVGGRKNTDAEVDDTSEIYFPHWIYKKVELHEEELGLHGIVSEVENEMARKMIIVGLWCIQTNPLSRPTITRVLEMLEEDLVLLEIPPKPYWYSPLRSIGSSSTS